MHLKLKKVIIVLSSCCGSVGLTYVFAAAVPADAAQAAVDHLDAAENQLQHPNGQQDGEQDHVPHHRVVGGRANVPQRLIPQVAAPAGQTPGRPHLDLFLYCHLMVIH